MKNKIVKQTNKITGVTYVYEIVESYWDKEKRQARNKQVCIGKLHPETGEFIQSKRLLKEKEASEPAVTAEVSIMGTSLVMDKITQELEMDKLLKRSFPEEHRQILSMAYYLVSRGDALSHLESWSKNHAHPYNGIISSQRISEILKQLSMNKQLNFYRDWMSKVMESDYLCYDITSISSYTESNEYVRYGYNRDHDPLKQINLAMLYGQKSKLPVFYQRMPGSINDVRTLQNLLKNLSKLDFSRLHYVLDKGFYSKDNIDYLVEKKSHFTIAVPLKLKWVQESIDAIRDQIEHPDNLFKINEDILYFHSQIHYWGEEHRRCYLHLYYNPYIATHETQSFNEKLLMWKSELESGNTQVKNEEAYEKYFIVSKTAKQGLSVKYNEEEILKRRQKYSGFLPILSCGIKDPIESLTIYRNKDVVEKSFDNLKNQLDMKRLRIHSSASMDGRLFVQFIALVYMSYIRNKIQNSDLNQKYTVREIIQEMESLCKISYSGKRGALYTVPTKLQKNILDSFNINLSNS